MASTSISRQEQYHHENMTWERSIEFFRQENNYLKNRLSEVVDHKTGKDFLALAEHFQNSFILKDEFMDELKHDIHAQEMALKDSVLSGKTGLSERTIKHQNKLRNEMEYLEKDFAQLKNEFNKYLATVL
jgi:hypothetical protein